MSRAREQILRRVRDATADVERGEPASWDPAAWDPAAEAAYDRDPEIDDPAGLFAERVADFRATVTRVRSADGVAAAVSAAAERSAAKRIAVARDLDRSWCPGGLEILEEPALSLAELDATDGVLTSCALAIAQTGTIVLDGGHGQGPRRLTLVPDLHICVVLAEQIVASVPAGVRELRDAAVAGRPLTFVSGPSATSDIELDRVEGVHGPRTLEVVVVG